TNGNGRARPTAQHTRQGRQVAPLPTRGSRGCSLAARRRVVPTSCPTTAPGATSLAPTACGRRPVSIARGCAAIHAPATPQQLVLHAAEKTVGDSLDRELAGDEPIDARCEDFGRPLGPGLNRAMWFGPFLGERQERSRQPAFCARRGANLVGRLGILARGNVGAIPGQPLLL